MGRSFVWTPPKIIFDKKTLPSKKEISNKYVNFCNKGLAPKHLKVRRDFLEEEVEALFGPSMNMNGYSYCHTNDEEVIARVENLFMVIHQQSSKHPHDQQDGSKKDHMQEKRKN
jgi:hypothetical protein